MTTKKLADFYLGTRVDPIKGKITDQTLYYDSKNFLTHAVCVGMTGSGKTGLGIALLEEAGLDKIPAIIIDPKGDLGNLLLTFPHLSADEFLPWIDPVEAERKGETPEAYAAEIAKTWQDGLKSSNENIERIQQLNDSVDRVIYTPANNSGRPISIMRSFEAPPKEVVEDATIFRDRIMSLTSTILGLLGISADPLKSREHILISRILDESWRKGTNLDLVQLIKLIQKPPFEMVGALDIDTFFPVKDRTALSVSLNNLLAAPGFQAWMEGDPLDIDQILYTKEGKPKLSIFSIAHLSDSERMFFVTILLNEIISWMRQQTGSSNLKALLYMDEIYGYFPPTAMPPSKTPMLTLLKQARAYGLGIVLATQNPVDLDYKGLANCGTWFIGRLQTDRDKARVTEGLQAASNGEIDSASLTKMLAIAGKQTFIMRSIYEQQPILFKTRWTLSYLRGPLTLAQIRTFKKTSEDISPLPSTPVSGEPPASLKLKPVIPIEISELFAKGANTHRPISYLPRLLGTTKLHFVDAKNKIDLWKEVLLAAPMDDDGKGPLWEHGEDPATVGLTIGKDAHVDDIFATLPPSLIQFKNYPSFEKSLATYLYQNQTLTIYHSAEFGLSSKDGQSEAEFRNQLFALLQPKQKEITDKIRSKYDVKRAAINYKLKNIQDKLTDNQKKSLWQWVEAIIGIITTVINAAMGKKLTKGTISQAGTSLKRTSKLGMNTGSSRLTDEQETYQKQLEELEDEQQKEMTAAAPVTSPAELTLDSISIHPRKSDITVEKMELLWVPQITPP